MLAVPELYGRGAVSATDLSDEDETDDDDDDVNSDVSEASSVNRDALTTSLLCSQHPGLKLFFSSPFGYATVFG